jgi:D-3-phosphoglycerate dehydrogenase
MKPLLLVLISLAERHRAALAEYFEVLYTPDTQERERTIASHGNAVHVVLTNGTIGLRADEIDRLPALELVSALGAGYENIARDAALGRGIVVSNGAGTNAACVADHAFALLLAAVRAVPRYDAACRAGVWRDALPERPMLAGRRLGVVGLGHIGREVARRAAGFDIDTGYHNRTPRDGATSRYFDSLLDLARWSDFLVVATPGGPQTHHLIHRAVLDALGPDGFLVNVARGSVVDTAALADALRERTLGGAALDVYEGEPQPPAALLALDNVVLTPHVAGTSPQSVDATVRHFMANAQRHFAGEAVLTPV